MDHREVADLQASVLVPVGDGGVVWVPISIQAGLPPVQLDGDDSIGVVMRVVPDGYGIVWQSPGFLRGRIVVAIAGVSSGLETEGLGLPAVCLPEVRAEGLRAISVVRGIVRVFVILRIVSTTPVRGIPRVRDGVRIPFLAGRPISPDDQRTHPRTTTETIDTGQLTDMVSVQVIHEDLVHPVKMHVHGDVVSKAPGAAVEDRLVLGLICRLRIAGFVFPVSIVDPADFDEHAHHPLGSAKRRDDGPHERDAHLIRFKGRSRIKPGQLRKIGITLVVEVRGVAVAHARTVAVSGALWICSRSQSSQGQQAREFDVVAP